MEVVNNFLSSAVQEENWEQQESGKAMTCIRQVLQIGRIRKRGNTRHLLKAIVQSRANHNTYSYNHI